MECRPNLNEKLPLVKSISNIRKTSVVVCVRHVSFTWKKCCKSVFAPSPWNNTTWLHLHLWCYLLTNTYSLFSRKYSRSGSTVSTVFSLSDIFFLTMETLTFVQFSSWYIIFVPTYDLSQAAFPSLWRFFLRFQNICSNFRRTFEKLILVLPHLTDLVHRIK